MSEFYRADDPGFRPHLVEPDITITSAAAPPITLELLLIALVLGAVLLFPSYYYLFRIFKTPQSSTRNTPRNTLV